MRTGQIAHKHWSTWREDIQTSPMKWEQQEKAPGRGEQWKARGSRAVDRSDQRKADDGPPWLAVSLEQFLWETGSSWQVSIDWGYIEMQESRRVNAQFLEVRLYEGEWEPSFWSLPQSICSAEAHRLVPSVYQSLSDLRSCCPGLSEFPIKTSALFSAHPLSPDASFSYLSSERSKEGLWFPHVATLEPFLLRL